jgi:predicted RND superfamily exporter protein
VASAEVDAPRGLINRFAAGVTRSAVAVVAGVLLLTALSLVQLVDFSTGTVHLRVEASAEGLLAGDDEATRFYQQMRRLFGNDQAVIVTLQSEALFSPKQFDRLTQMTFALERINGVNRVQSLANAVLVDGTDYGMDVTPVFERYPLTEAGMQSLRDRVMQDPIYARNLVSAAGDNTVVIIVLEEGLDYARQQQIGKEVAELIDKHADGFIAGITGIPHIDLETTGILLDDLRTMPLLVTLVIAAVLALSFRSLRAVVIPLLSMFVTVVWTLATIVALGYALNIVTVLVPPLLMILSLSYAVHVVAEFDAFFAGDSTRKDPATPLAKIVIPVILTGLTTMVGFLSLMVSPLQAVKQFGLFALIGVFYATLLSLLLVPVLTLLWQRMRPLPRAGRASSAHHRFDRVIGRVAAFDVRHRRAIYAVTAVVVIIALAGMTQIRVSMEHLSNFRPDSDVRQAFEAANRQLHGVNLFYVTVDAGHRDAFKQPVNLREIEALQNWLLQQQEIGGALSVVDHIKLINSAINNNEPASRVIPDSRELIGQLVFLGSSDEMERLVDSRFQVTNLVVRAGVVDSDAVLALVNKINARLDRLPDNLQARVTGYPVLVNQAVDRIVRGQAESVFLAVAVVYLLLVLMFLSFRVGFIALIPNLVPIVVYFGALGLCGISLNPSTSLIAPMVLGIAIDDTIHYMARFNLLARRSTTTEQAAASALRRVGRPITFTSLGLCLGFLVLTTSELRMQEQVGLMAALALVFAWATDVLLTPALCSRLKIATLWDVLSVDLGARPQETIPLFHGLSAFQARIFARMMSMIEVPGGQRLISKGDRGDAMYVVIDGELQASIERAGRTIRLDRHGRGDLVGEAGLFCEKRTADVDVVKDARLVRISGDNLKVLARRYPRIAARIYRNLNAALAGRLVNATERIGYAPA